MNQRKSVLPGFPLSLGITVLYLGLIVLIPLSALLIKTTSMSFSSFIQTVTDPRVLSAYRVVV